MAMNGQSHSAFANTECVIDKPLRLAEAKREEQTWIRLRRGNALSIALSWVAGWTSVFFLQRVWPDPFLATVLIGCVTAHCVIIVSCIRMWVEARSFVRRWRLIREFWETTV